MKKILLPLLFLVVSLAVQAQEGVRFQDITFEEAKAQAQKENKWLFVDMSMAGCMPCKYMLEKVFVLPEVGAFFNERFVCVHYNASTQEEGAEVMKMFDVSAFPTFLFFNPENGNLAHRSIGGRSAEEIIEVAKRGFNPATASVGLEEKYVGGNREFDFLVDYYAMHEFDGNEGKMRLIVNTMSEIWGAKFKDPRMNEFFFDHVKIKRNPLTDYFLANTSKMIKKFGKEKVYKKIGELK